MGNVGDEAIVGDVPVAHVIYLGCNCDEYIYILFIFIAL